MSERYKSAEQLLEQHIRDMGDPLGRVYNALSSELSWLHVKWRMYQALYTKSEARTDLLNRAAPYFFAVLQGVLLDELLLHLGRMTDPESIRGRDNLTVQRLPSLVPPEIREEVAQLITTVLSALKPLRPWRNRRVAHTDLEVAIAGLLIPGVTFAQIEAALSALRATLNGIEQHFWKSQTVYEHVIAPLGDADALVFHLFHGLRVEDGRRQRFKQGTPLPEDLGNQEIP